ncbi:MAG: hypothetical protein HOP11_11035 [Saprospiraceae bacterium]|nr:hypothetical protein [Saprospiraceae bacterium]
MQVSYQSTATNQGKLNVKIVKDDFLPEVSKEIENIRKNAKIKGFRQGAVPQSMITKLYGETIKAEVLNKLVNKAIENYQTENNLSFLGDLMPDKNSNGNQDLQKDEMEFSFNVGIAPELDLNKFIDEVRLPSYKIVTTEKDIDAELVAFMNHFSTYNNILTEIQSGDMVKLKVNELLSDSIKEGGIESEFSVLLDEHLTEEFTNILLNKKTGDSFHFNIRNVEKEMDEKTIRKYFLKISDDQQFENEFKAEIIDVSRKSKPELNEELFKKAYGENTEISTLEQLRSQLQSDLEKHYESESSNFINYYLYKQTLQWKDLQYPDEFLKEWLTNSFEEWKNKSEHDFNHDIIHFKEGLNWQLFKKVISSRTKIDVQLEDVVNIIKQKYHAQIPGLNFNDEQWNQVSMNVLKDETKAKEFISEAQTLKTQAWLRDQMMKTEIEISIDDFKAKVKELNAHKH